MPACPACGHPDARRALTLGAFGIDACGACAHRYVAGDRGRHAASVQYEQAYYQAGDSPQGYANYLHDLERREQGFRWLVRFLDRFRPERGRLLDYGCAIGLFVKVAREAGWRARGLETSAWAARYGREQWGLEIETGPGDFAPGSFDAVTLWDVLEHLAEPGDVLQRAHDWLAPGGILALNTVDVGGLGARLAGARWRHYAPPQHLHYFTRASLAAILERCGFAVVDWRAGGVCLGAARDRHLGPIGRGVESLVTHWRMRPLALALNLLDEIMVIARKPG